MNPQVFEGRHCPTVNRQRKALSETDSIVVAAKRQPAVVEDFEGSLSLRVLAHRGSTEGFTQNPG